LIVPMTILEALLADLPTGKRVTDVYVGANWTLALAEDSTGLQCAGVAGSPRQIPPDARFQIGHHRLNQPAESVAQGLRASDETLAAVGLAAVNALIQPDDTRLTTDDAADWLSARCVGRRIALFGRFPFIDQEVRPFAQQVWVFERQPQAGELDSAAVSAVLPQADIVAITGSAVINHTIDQIMPHIRPGSTVIILGPSTPLSGKLLESGIDGLFGVRVTHIQQAIESVVAGVGFQQMNGLQRVALLKT
jgi:uncharacterized protein